MRSKFGLGTSFLVTTLAVSSLLGVTFAAQAQLPPVSSVIYVDPVNSLNTAETGTSANPYKTITDALSQAKPGTVIQLAPGNYSNESFPIKLKPGVTLRGDESSRGERVVISGGGDYISSIFAKQNITIVANQDTVIAGVTVTNKNERGTGVWVESTNPIIRNSSFISNAREGVFVTGQGNPRIENNRFVQNSANGISITKKSRGEIRNNLFQNNGFGLVIGNTSTPSLTENQIVQNKDGIVISESAKPLVRKNTIQNNQRDGVVLIHDALPDLGTSNNPGGNIIANNSRYNFHNATKNNTMFDVTTTETPDPSQNADLSSGDPNIALLKKWELTPIACNSGSEVVTIIISRRQYCITPHPDLTAKRYQYNQSTGNFKALAEDSPTPNSSRLGGGL
jgi:parallel beta-helix repeat protein